MLEPITQTWINFSHGAYADDMFRMGLSEDAQTASSRIQEWDRALAAHVSEPTGLQQNTDKKEVLFRAYGRGSHQKMQKFYKKQDLNDSFFSRFA